MYNACDTGDAPLEMFAQGGPRRSGQEHGGRADEDCARQCSGRCVPVGGLERAGGQLVPECDQRVRARAAQSAVGTELFVRTSTAE